MLFDCFYSGSIQETAPEQKTHTAFKWLSCLSVLKYVKFMTHLRNHLELERQKGDSWEIQTTSQRSHRQFPTSFQLQCHTESVHASWEPSTVCNICELSFKTDQVLLQHMKDSQTLGKMPYVCCVCNYRLSVFANVEAYFRTWHGNMNNLPVCFASKFSNRWHPLQIMLGGTGTGGSFHVPSAGYKVWTWRKRQKSKPRIISHSNSQSTCEGCLLKQRSWSKVQFSWH